VAAAGGEPRFCPSGALKKGYLIIVSQDDDGDIFPVRPSGGARRGSYQPLPADRQYLSTEYVQCEAVFGSLPLFFPPGAHFIPSFFLTKKNGLWYSPVLNEHSFMQSRTSRIGDAIEGERAGVALVRARGGIRERPRRHDEAAPRGGPVEEERKKLIKQLFYLSSIGLSMVLAIFIGLAIGVFLDNRFKTHPWLTLIFLGVGIVAGFRNIFWFIRHYGLSDTGQNKKHDGKDT
jgi:ATP synthase protein I